MKKIYFILLSFLIILISCNSDVEKDFENKSILPKTLIYKKNESSYTSVINLVYDGNKILSVGNKNMRNEYLYDGDKIVKETKYNYESGKELKISESIFSYENDKLFAVDKIEYGQEFKYFYIYNEDGTITKGEYDLVNKAGKEFKKASNSILTIENGNLKKTVSNWGYDDIITSSRYEYDTNTNPFKNILGFNLLLDEIYFGSELNLSSSNNLTRHVFVPINSGGIIFEFYTNNMVYEYNKNGYPTKKTTYDYTGKAIDIIEYQY